MEVEGFEFRIINRMGMMRTFIALLLILVALPALARMYQWTDPDNGKTHLSGTPPAWYRSSDDDGPRVFVLDKGQLIDDTGVEVTDENRRRLRQEAVIAAEENQDAARLKAEEAAMLGEQFRRNDNSNAKPPELMLPEVSENAETEGAADSQADDMQLSAEEMAALRDLVADWEARNESINQQQVQSLIDDADTAEPPPLTREQLQDFLDRNTDCSAQD